MQAGQLHTKGNAAIIQPCHAVKPYLRFWTNLSKKVFNYVIYTYHSEQYLFPNVKAQSFYLVCKYAGVKGQRLAEHGREHIHSCMYDNLPIFQN